MPGVGVEVGAAGIADQQRIAGKHQRGLIVLIDVRPGEEFDAGHIAGARSVPLGELEGRLAELPADREVVAYCRGPICAYAHEAVRRLRAAGRDARRLDEGWREWRLEHQPTGTTTTGTKAA